MLKKMFLVAVIGVCMAFGAGTVFAANQTGNGCYGCNPFDSAYAEADAYTFGIGNFSTFGNGFGIAGGLYEGHAYSDAFGDGIGTWWDPVEANAFADVFGYSHGFAFSLADVDLPCLGTSFGFGISMGETSVWSNTYSWADGGILGLAGTFNYVEGTAIQWNGVETWGDYEGGSFYAGGVNETGAGYVGVNGDFGYSFFGCGGAGSGLYGDANADGMTLVGGFTTGDYSQACAVTFGYSEAFQSGYGMTHAFGAGEVRHMTFASDGNGASMATAGTTGYAGFTYSNCGFNYVNGYGVASTGGSSWADVGSNSMSSGASSHSSSMSGRGFNGY